MKNRRRLLKPIPLLFAALLCQGTSFNALATGGVQHCQLLIAKQLFDGVNPPQANMAVLIEGDKVNQVGPPDQLQGLCGNRINLGDATILPGFIESHAHITFQDVKKDRVLEHGITTARDTGGPSRYPEGGQGTLRLLSVGPIIQAPDGYPLNIFAPGDLVGGYDKIGIAVLTKPDGTNNAEQIVQDLVKRGATAIKISLENGDTNTEFGAPWLMPHDGPVPGSEHWNVLPDAIVETIVKKAHKLHRRVIAHVGENKGFQQALKTGVDEFAHIPCAAIEPTFLEEAANKPGLTFVTTIDTLSSCVDFDKTQSPPQDIGIHSNTEKLAQYIKACEESTPGQCAKFIYGSEVAHDNVPWGINGEELHMMFHLTFTPDPGDPIEIAIGKQVLKVLKSATSDAGKNLGIPGLGTLTHNAPADIIAVKGDPFKRFKLLEYPDLVISGGHIVVNKFSK